MVAQLPTQEVTGEELLATAQQLRWQVGQTFHDRLVDDRLARDVPVPCQGRNGESEHDEQDTTIS